MCVPFPLAFLSPFLYIYNIFNSLLVRCLLPFTLLIYVNKSRYASGLSWFRCRVSASFVCFRSFFSAAAFAVLTCCGSYFLRRFVVAAALILKSGGALAFSLGFPFLPWPAFGVAVSFRVPVVCLVAGCLYQIGAGVFI